ncbi:DUF4238 domain-containing protein [Paenibacillus sp. FSL K6-1217]|uniref:DUF4238 domain-containing protein n=1 Tax=Paenibacillus sp. FSL K6-1217 TaxID=2921466 RepID=UPI00324AD3FE
MQDRRNHYIPQFYLKGFLDYRVEPPQKPSLWVLDKKEDTLCRKGTKNVAKINGYYDMKLMTGEITTVVESFFSKQIEGPSSLILKKILGYMPINEDERFQFSEFIYYSLVRVPNFLNYMSWFHKNGSKLNFDKTKVELTKAKIEAAGIGDEGISTLELMIEMSRFFVPMIYKMNWQFFRASKNQYFVTSDNPVILNNPDEKQINLSFSGWENPGIHLTFPLSSNMCLRATWTKRSKIYVKADLKFMRAINFRTSFYATRYVFSSRPILPPPIDSSFFYNEIDIYESKSNWE